MGEETHSRTIRHSRCIPPSLAGSHAFHTLDRRTLGIITQARTGYGHFGEYYQTHNIREPANCPRGADLQTREHIVFECQTHEEYSDIMDEGAPDHQLSILFGTWPNSSEKARRSRKHEPQRPLRRHQTQNRVIRDPDVQRDPIETPARPTKTSPTERGSDNRTYRITDQTRQRSLEAILENVL